MALGFGALKLSPIDFWLMTPREIDAALMALTASSVPTIPPEKEELDRLMKRFPDLKR